MLSPPTIGEICKAKKNTLKNNKIMLTTSRLLIKRSETRRSNILSPFINTLINSWSRLAKVSKTALKFKLYRVIFNKWINYLQSLVQ